MQLARAARRGGPDCAPGVSSGGMAGIGCVSCGTENPARAGFCMSCGNKLATGAPSPAAAQQEARLPEERRQVTVLFADLTGYTAVAERMDPEAVKAVVERSLRRLGVEV